MKYIFANYICKIRGALCFILLVLTLVKLQAANQVIFNTIHGEYEYKDAKITSIEKDLSGYIWIASDIGLCKYDGYNYTYFNQPELQNKYINKLYCSKLGILAGTNSGLYLYNKNTASFKAVKITESELPINVRTIYSYKDKYYIGTNNGVFILNSKLKFESHIIFANSLSSCNNNIVRAITSDSHGNIWFGTFNGVYRYLIKENLLQSIKTMDKFISDPANNLVLCFGSIPENNNLLMIGHETGLSIIDINTLKYKVYRKENNCDISNNTIKCVKYIQNSTVVLGTDNGLNYLDLKSNKIKSYYHILEDRYSLPNNVISDILVDNRNGLLWLATNRGVSQTHIFNRSNGILHTMVNHNLYLEMHNIIPQQDKLWITTSNGVVCVNNKVDNLNSKFFKYNSNIIFRDNSDIIWIGTINGINYINKESVNAVKPAQEGAKYVIGIHQAINGKRWVVAKNGIYSIAENGNYYILNRETSLNRDKIKRYFTETNVSILKNNKIWLGTNTGIFYYDICNHKIVRFNNINNSNIKGITSAKDNILFCTSSTVYIYDTSKNEVFKLPISYIDGSILNLYANDNNVIIPTTKLLYVYNLKSKTCSLFDYVNDFPLGGESPQCIYYDNSHLIVGGYGYYIISNGNFIKGKGISPIAITQIAVNNINCTLHDNSINLAHSDNNLNISFSLLCYPNLTHNQYRYRLKGYDSSWKYTIDDNVIYSNLSPGEYIFEVYGANDDGVWSQSPSILHIKIASPWWSSYLGILFFIILLAIIYYVILHIIKWRVKVLSKKKAEDLKQENISELNKMRLQFFAKVSNEFKTPLSLILGPIESLLHEFADNKNASIQLNILNKNAIRLRRFIEQIMSFCKLENNEVLKLNLQMGDIVSFTENVFKLFNYDAEQKNITLSFSSDLESASVMFDRDKIEEILYSLIDNALKFTNEGGTIQIRIYLDSSELICIEIIDNGIGINSTELDKIFLQFYQADNELIKSGTGIGLSIVKQYIEMHNGKILVESEINQGSSFRIMLPILSICKDKAEVIERDNEKPLIIVIEDNYDMMEYIKINLSKDYNIFGANDDTSGWNLITTNIPDIIISDVNMPKINGFDICRKVRNEIRTEHIPIILLTSLNSETNIKEGYDAGANSYITKPFSINRLKLKIISILQDRKRIQNNIKLQMIQQPSIIKKESPNEVFIDNFVKIVESQIDNPNLNVEILCSQLGFSHQQTYRKVHAITGHSINSFIRLIRIKRAAQLLQDTDMNISEIMDAIGISNRTFFIKTFKEEYKKAPSEYREAHSN